MKRKMMGTSTKVRMVFDKDTKTKRRFKIENTDGKFQQALDTVYLDKGLFGKADAITVTIDTDD